MKNSASLPCRLMSLLAALCLLLTLAPAALAETAAALPEPAGNAAFLPGDLAGKPITDMDGAAQVVAALNADLTADGRTAFAPWRTLTDTAGNVYYVFRQMYAETTVSGGAVKIVTDAAGKMIGAVSSVETDLPDAALAQGIDAREAESVVRAHEIARLGHEVELLEGQTEKIILPVNLELDPYSDEEKEESRFVWAVYTLYTEGGVAQGSDLPYLAHYVTMDGAYLYSLPTLVPGDAAAQSGYNAAYVFQFMESVPYTGTVTMPDGSAREVTVDVMRDSRTGVYYLGNLERRIVVADCYPFVYENGTVRLEASLDNTGWDETSLMSLYNYCRAWDYYAAIGWRGGDGLETPMMILKDYCDANGTPVDNAAYAGQYYGWQVFLSSDANQFSKALDVLAHEFTHCVTGSVMTYNAYMNDYGAINEAISDIQGNLCEMLMGDTQDAEWRMGENSGMIVRSMSKPHEYQQPEHAWDLYYQPKVQTPTDINDRGGVHRNSSLLNRVAYLLCEEGGMTLEEARAFWFAVDCAMVPGTDYPQLAKLLPWVMSNLGLDQYLPALNKAIQATALNADAQPEALPDHMAMLQLTLPDQEIFTDGNWTLYVVSVDVPALTARIQDVQNGRNGCENAIPELMECLFPPKPEKPVAAESEESFLDQLLGVLKGEKQEEPAPVEQPEESELAERLAPWVQKYFADCFFVSNTAAGQDGRTIRMVMRPGTALPVLLQMKMKAGTVEPETMDIVAHLFGTWIDLGALTSLAEKSEEEIAAWMDGVDFNALMEKLLGPEGEAFDLQKLLNRAFTHIPAGGVVELPADGLESVQLMDMDELTAEQEPEQETEQEAEQETAE